MEMVVHSEILALPKATTETKDIPAPKKGQDEECCLSFPSMLEQKQAAETKKGIAATPATVIGSGPLIPVGNSTEEGPVNTGTAGAVLFKTELSGSAIFKTELPGSAIFKNELPVAAGSEGQIASLSSFLKSLPLVDSDEPNQVEALKKAPEITTTSQTDVSAIVEGISESAANILKNSTVEASTKVVPTETSAASSLQVVAPMEATMQVSQEVPSADPKSLTPNSNPTVELSEPMPEKTKAAIAKPAMETTAQPVDKPVPQKPQGIVRDVVLASNKTPESTYAAPEKMVMEKPIQKAVFSEAPSIVESDLSNEIKGKAKTADTGKVVSQIPQAAPLDTQQPISTPPEIGTEAPPTGETAPVQIDSQAALENFTVPAEIKMNIGTTSTQATPEVNHDSNTANIRRQVVQHLASRMEGPLGGEKITLYLNPEKLGQVEVQITAKNDTLTVVLTAGEGQVEKAIQDSVKDLTESLLARGGRFQQVDVKVESKGTQNDREQSRQEENKDKESKNQQDSHKGHDQQKESKQFAWAPAMQEG